MYIAIIYYCTRLQIYRDTIGIYWQYAIMVANLPKNTHLWQFLQILEDCHCEPTSGHMEQRKHWQESQKDLFGQLFLFRICYVSHLNFILVSITAKTTHRAVGCSYIAS